MVIILASFLIISCICHVISNLCDSSLNTCEHSSVVYSSFRNTLEWEKNAFWARICFPSQFTAIPVFFWCFFLLCTYSHGVLAQALLKSTSVPRGWLLKTQQGKREHGRRFFFCILEHWDTCTTRPVLQTTSEVPLSESGREKRSDPLLFKNSCTVPQEWTLGVCPCIPPSHDSVPMPHHATTRGAGLILCIYNQSLPIVGWLDGRYHSAAAAICVGQQRTTASYTGWM